MQNLYSAQNKPPKGVKEKLRYFFKETFRPHSKEEYAEVFTRGLGSCSENVSRKLPWLYIRVFALNLILFSTVVFGFRLASYTADYLTAILLGGLLFNFPLLIFFYELYPKRDLSLLKLFAVLLVGGAVTTVIIVFGYQFIYSTQGEPNAWISTLWVGFWEEFVKGAAGIAAIAILKNKNPLCCFLIGFAVGTGYSFAEDLGYIYSLSRSSGITWLVLTSVGRGLSCVCSHAPWTAMICWAFAKFKKPFLNFRFYGISIAMMALHYFADVPFFDENLNILRGVTVGWAIEAVVVISIFVAVFFVLKSCFKEIFEEAKPEYPQVNILTERARLSQAANLTAVLCAIALSVFALAGCAMKVGDKKVYAVFYDEEEFIEYVQQGLPLNADWDREYDVNEPNYSEFFANGNLLGATQKVEGGEDGYDYFYVYYFGGEETELESVGVRVGGELCYCSRFEIYEDYYFASSGRPYYYAPVDDTVDDEGAEDAPEEAPEEPTETPAPVKVVRFFNVGSIICGYSFDGGYFSADTGETEFIGLGGIIALSVLSGVTVIGGSAAYITLKIKARRKENA
ncbi:MAG: PrsW family intramembrane metalloprotease [Clostridia bacterium]|nr:PrsW family intramembrane metalloprotease [Clostridia bacterium]